MSFVESWSAVSEAAADPAFTLCVTGVVLLIGALVALPALGSVLGLLQAHGRLGKRLWNLLSTHTRRRDK